MQFNSLEYALFLGAIVAGYRFLSHRLQNLLLLVASYAFYAAWDWRISFPLLVFPVPHLTPPWGVSPPP